MTRPCLSCRELTEFLMAYLDGELAPERREAFEAHMSLCPPCVAYIQSYEETIRLAKTLCKPEAPAPVDVPERLIRAILAARPKQDGASGECRKNENERGGTT